MPKVSILLPVFNSLSNYEKKTDFLSQTITSIINQTYQDFELLIRDNQSSDKTVGLCQSFANLDGRIKVEVDNQRRSAEEAIGDMLNYATGEFICCLSDDDLIHPEYLRLLLAHTQGNDLTYSNGLYIDVNNNAGIKLILTQDGMYDPNALYYDNFNKAIHRRIVLPVLFGLFRRDTYQSLMPNKPFDELRANMDNLLMARFFLNRYKAKFVDADLFYYRQRSRALNPESLSYMPTNPILIWVYYVRHQLYFYNAVKDTIESTNHKDKAEPLKISVLDSCLNQCLILLNWVARDLAQNAFEHAIIKGIYKEFKPIFDLRLTCFSHTPELLWKHTDAMRLRCKILEERVLESLKEIVQEIELIEDTQEVVQRIKIDCMNSPALANASGVPMSINGLHMISALTPL